MNEQILRSKKAWIAGGILLFSSSLFLSWWQPSDKLEHSVCFFRQVTTIPCPGCGLTRGAAAWFSFDPKLAIQKHPLSPLFALEAFFLWFCWGLIAVRSRPIPSVGTVNRLLVIHAGLLITVWAYRLTTGILPGLE